jgi:hypothetical protein
MVFAVGRLRIGGLGGTVCPLDGTFFDHRGPAVGVLLDLFGGVTLA